jgi:hypothetical protein
MTTTTHHLPAEPDREASADPAILAQRLAADLHQDTAGVISRGGTGWHALARQMQRDRAIIYSAARRVAEEVAA